MTIINKSLKADELPAPTVREAENNHISADIDFATVEIQPYTNMAVGDKVDLLWNADVTGHYTDYIPVSAATVGHVLTFQVSSELIATNHEAAVSYVVTRVSNAKVSSFPLALSIGEPVLLPAPSVDKVTGSIINPEEHPDGVTVRVPADANLMAGDLVTVHWVGQSEEGTTETEQTVGGSGAGKDLTVHILASAMTANEGYQVEVSYTVTRVSGSPEVSAVAVYDIGTAVSGGSLKVMGARSQRKGSQHGLISPVRTLNSLSRDTLTPQEATWQYEGEAASFSGIRFRDTQPDRLLHVRTADDHVILNVSNINGNTGAIVARRDAGNMVAWGVAANGGEVPSTIMTLTDIAEVVASSLAFAARRANGTVVAWGTTENGGAVPPAIATLTDITALSGNGMAFAALRKKGSVVAWGTADSGGTVPSEIATLTDIVQIRGTYNAFSALHANGSVVAWGNVENGGLVSTDIANLTDMVEIIANEYAFAAMRENGSVVAWGRPEYGGQVPADIATLTDVVEVIPGNTTFAARRANGTVVAWGEATKGGVVPLTVAMLEDIVSVVGTHSAFMALRANGHVVAWGDAVNGGEVPPTIATLDDIVQILGVSKGGDMSAFIALRADGSVVAWGDSGIGGNISTEIQSKLTDVRAVYCADSAVAALTSDSRVVTWGTAASGGDSSAVQNALDGQVSYEATGASRGIGYLKAK